jgi:YVTN family beta-propeller protein
MSLPKLTIRRRSELGAAFGILLFLACQTDAEELFVSNERDNTVTVLDGESLKILRTIPVGERPRGIVITPDHHEVLVCATVTQTTSPS